MRLLISVLDEKPLIQLSQREGEFISPTNAQLCAHGQWPTMVQSSITTVVLLSLGDKTPVSEVQVAGRCRAGQ